ncbi:MAG: hypothetical protein FWE64_04655, partial [Alphaproteobacteria bacterium]|nr:hypothetical protein [Alphaproteobacteria bacterium]
KRSSPALAVRIENTVWYGTLASGTAPGRLTLRMPPAGQIFSLVAPFFTFSAIEDDFPQIYTWNQAFQTANPVYNLHTVSTWAHWITVFAAQHAALPVLGIWPTYHVQAMCSNTAGTPAQPGAPVHAVNGSGCWCRLKRQADNANGGWVFSDPYGSAGACAGFCPINCAFAAAENSVFRNAVLREFTAP